MPRNLVFKRLLAGVFCGLLAAPVFAGVRFQDGKELTPAAAGPAQGAVQYVLPKDGEGGAVMALPAAVAVTPVLYVPVLPDVSGSLGKAPVVPVAAAVSATMDASATAAAAEVARKEKARVLATRVCAENLALVRGLGLTAYQVKPRPDVMKVVLAAAMAERQANSGELPPMKGLAGAMADVPFYVGGIAELRTAVSSARGACGDNGAVLMPRPR